MCAALPKHSNGVGLTQLIDIIVMKFSVQLRLMHFLRQIITLILFSEYKSYLTVFYVGCTTCCILIGRSYDEQGCFTTHELVYHGCDQSKCSQFR